MLVRTTLLLVILASASLLAAEPVSVSRTTGDFRVTITLTDTEPRGIASISIQHGKERFTLPSSMFDDIRTPHLGIGFKPAEFRLDVKRSKAFIRISAGIAPHKDDHGWMPDDHTWILPLPLKDGKSTT